MQKLYKTTQLVNNEDLFFNSFSVSIEGNRGVWLAGEFDTDDEVYYFNGSEVAQITDNNGSELSPQIFQDNVLWLGTLDNVGSTQEIFTYDGESTVSTDGGDGISIDNLRGDGGSIFYTGTSGTGGILGNNNGEFVEIPIVVDDVVTISSNVDVSTNRVVWSQVTENEETLARDSEIFLYNGTETVQITDNRIRNDEPKVAGDFVVWIGQEETDTEIFLYDGNTTTKVTDNDVNDSNAVVSNTGLVAWEDQENIYVYQNGTTTTLDLKESAGDDIYLDAGENDIFISANSGLYSFDGEDLNQISSENPLFFDVSGENIIWANPSAHTITLAIPYAPNTVFRFLNTDTGVHFYTSSVEEAKNTIDNFDNYTFEEGSYVGIDPLTGQQEPSSVYRFLNLDTGVHLYTISEAERDAVQQLNNYSFEGESFFAYETEVEGTIPVYRFFNPTTGAHFYTSSASERDNVGANLPDYQSEGIAYYVLPSEI